MRKNVLHCLNNFKTHLNRKPNEFRYKSEMVRVLNVAEKNDAAKSIAGIMSRGNSRRRNGKSVYNKIYEYEYDLFNQRCQMVMTSVSGHLLNMEFSGSYRKWQVCNPVSLFEAPIVIECLQNYQPIKLTLEEEVRKCNYLIIWTDGDREGENIGFEIIDVCKKVKSNIRVFRARFSEITSQAVARACANLVEPDKRASDAVNVRRELDLRIGAAFTRFQTLRLKRVFPDILGNQLISYGSCQFPTLGFVVERYKQVMAFIPEAFWKLKVTHKKDESLTEFTWKRGKLFDHTACLVLYQLCLEQPLATVTGISGRNKSKWRPQPLDTVEFEKLSSRKLRINAKEAMTVAEKLYTKGFISYPRTETTIFPKEISLTRLVEMQANDRNWGGFAQRVLQWGPNPRQGTKTDNAHPPIHPTKYVDNLEGKEKTVYELIVRHFLACVSKDAEGRETTIEIDVNSEQFAVKGLVILAKNYLDVYPYDKWSDKNIGEYNLHETFQPTSIEMNEGETSAPDLLTEADLIGLMEKHGIGTDATHAEHIETIKSRLYVGLNENNRFIPGELGMGLVEGYDLMGLHLAKPNLRAGLEADLKRISEGTRNPDVVLREQVGKYKEYFKEVVRQAIKLDNALSAYLNVTPTAVVQEETAVELVPLMKCPKCQTGDIVLKTKRDNTGFFFTCLSYPSCNASMWLPNYVEQVSVLDEECTHCEPRHVKKLKIKVKAGSLVPFYPDEIICCLGGCDFDLLNALGVRPINSTTSNTSNTTVVPSRNISSDSGYDSANNVSRNSNQSSRTQSLSTARTSFQPPPSTPSNQNSSRNPFQPVPTSNNNNNNNNRRSNPSDDEIVCNCGTKAVVLTVRKEGNNQGRQFYKCSQMSDAKCDFFLWKDDDNQSNNSAAYFQSPVPSTSNQNTNNFSNSNKNNDSESIPECRCGLEAKPLVVRKEGENKGRPFFGCAKGMNESCGFFQWADEDPPSGNSSSNQNRTFRSSAGPSHRRQASSGSGGPPSKRRCGICSQTGHTRKKCPQNR